MALTKAEKRRLKKEKRREEQRAKEREEKGKALKKNVIIFSIVGLVIVLGVFYFVSQSKKPGYYDDFAKCLAEEGMVMYGADWCKFTTGQKEMFGKSFQYVNYKDYLSKEGITTTPTWDFEGERYPRVQTFETLSKISGCPLPG